MIPGSRPQYKKEDAIAVIERQGLKLDKAYIIAFRGYYSRTFPPVGNNIGVYDDALIFISPDCYYTANFNVDPSSQKQGRANLCTGISYFKKGIHNISKAKGRQYPALIQAGEAFKIMRYGAKGPKYETWRGINLHMGSKNSTSSAGCLTVPPGQWDEFIDLAYSQMDKWQQKKIAVILIDVG